MTSKNAKFILLYLLLTGYDQAYAAIDLNIPANDNNETNQFTKQYLDLYTLTPESKPIINLSIKKTVAQALQKSVQIQGSKIDLDLAINNLNNVVKTRFRPKLSLSLAGNLSRAANSFQQSPSLGYTASPSANATLALSTGTQLSFSQNTNVVVSSIAPSDRSTSSSIQVIQPLLKGRSFAVNMASEEIARSSLRSSVYAFKQQAIEFCYQVIMKSLDLTLANSQVKQSQEALAASKRLYELNKAMIATGRLAKSGLSQSDSDVAQSDLSLAQSNQNMRLLEQDLAGIVGFTQTDLVLQITDKVDELEGFAKLSSLSADEVFNLAQKSQSSILLGYEGIESAKQQILVAQDNMQLPLNFRVGLNQTKNLSFNNNSNDIFVGLDLQIDFYRAELELQKATAQAGLTKAEMHLTEQERQLRYAVNQAIGERDFAIERQKKAIAAANLAKERFEAELDRMSVGRVSVLDVTVAKSQWIAAEIQSLQANDQSVRAQLNILRLTGSLIDFLGLSNIVKGWTDVALNQ